MGIQWMVFWWVRGSLWAQSVRERTQNWGILGIWALQSAETEHGTLILKTASIEVLTWCKDLVVGWL